MAGPGLSFCGAKPSFRARGVAAMTGTRMRARQAAAALIGLAVVLLALSAAAETLRNEQLFVGIPDGWQKSYENSDATGSIAEYVPPGETTEAWSEMLTLQRYKDVLIDIPSYLQQVIERFTAGCVQGRHDGPRRSTAGAYPAGTAFVECRGPDPAKAMPGVVLKSIEFVAIKAIQGQNRALCRPARLAWQRSVLSPAQFRDREPVAGRGARRRALRPRRPQPDLPQHRADRKSELESDRRKPVWLGT